MVTRKRVVALVLLVALCLPLLPSCGRTRSYTETFLAMDTAFTVTIYTPDRQLAKQQFAICRTRLAEWDRALWSRQVPESEIARLNAGDKDLSLDDRTRALLEKSIAVKKATGGAFDVTLAPLSDLWQTCAAEARLPTDAELSAARSRSGGEIALSGNRLTVDPGTQIDLGGIAKGEAVALLCRALAASGLSGGLVSCGSNVAVFGEKPYGKPFRVAVRDPRDANRSVGTVILREGEILSVSGDYERFFTVNGKRYHHILDPATGYPAESGLSSVAVIAKDGGIADALSTALFVLGEENARKLYDPENMTDMTFEAVFVTSEGELHTTPGMEDLFTAS